MFGPPLRRRPGVSRTVCWTSIAPFVFYLLNAYLLYLRH
jgi:hypothetical protein